MQTSLETNGRTSAQPFATGAISSVTSTLVIEAATPVAYVAQPSSSAISNIFGEPISTEAPASNIRSRPDHPVPRKGIVRQPSRCTPKLDDHVLKMNTVRSDDAEIDEQVLRKFLAWKSDQFCLDAALLIAMEPGIWQRQIMGHERLPHRS